MKSTAPQRFLDQSYELATRLPWWASLLSALAAYALLHPIALLQMPTPTGTMDIVATALAQLAVLLAQLGQYLLPMVFLVAAAISGFHLWKREELRQSVTQDTSGSVLKGLPWTDFEMLVGDAFRRRGFEVCAPHTNRQPRDTALELRRDGQRFLVDCTDWRAWKAGVSAVRGLDQRMRQAGVESGFAVTSGHFAPEAQHFAADKGIELIDGRHLKELVRAKARSGTGDSSLLLAKLRSTLARSGEPSSTRHPSLSEATPRSEPCIGPAPEKAPNAALDIGQGTTAQELASSVDAETAAGRQLAALIRAERGLDGEIELIAPAVPAPQTDRSRRHFALPRIRARKIADLVGVLVTLGILWGLYAWFAQLPSKQIATPWALLGTGSDSEVLVKRMRGLTRTRSATRILAETQPLGQFQFGPPPGFLSTANLAKPAPEEPVEVYHSLRELEAAFDTKYIPPPECYAYQASAHMIKCGNHRIRARRAFIAGGGKVTPMLLGSWEEPMARLTERRLPAWRDGDEWQQEEQLNSPQDWNQEWQQYGDPDSWQDLNRETAPDPDQGAQSAPEPDRHWQRVWIREPAREPEQDWRHEGSPGVEDDWSRDWRSESEPTPIERRHWVDGF